MFLSYKSIYPNLLYALVLAYNTRSPFTRLHKKATIKTVSFAYNPALVTINHYYNRDMSTDAI
jgi:hypothetical protein